MKFALVIFAALVVVASAATDSEWAGFKAAYGKVYVTEAEETKRRDTFSATLDMVRQHNYKFNLGITSFTMGINDMSDMTSEEVSVRNGVDATASQDNVDESLLDDSEELPTHVDWRKKGAVTPIKNQGQCGSCWAFTAVASMEGQHFLHTRKLVTLSVQNLVDCSRSQGNYGCEGGIIDQAFMYVIANHGIDTEKSYPYTARDGHCHFNKNSVGDRIKAYKDVPSGSEPALEKAVATVGPISVAIDASHYSFQHYSSGVYYEPQCSSSVLDHGVTVVGYGALSGNKYYIVKNMWGTTWGMKGYVFMSRDKANNCGIATRASWPIQYP